MTLMKIKRVDAEAKPCIIKAITAFDSWAAGKHLAFESRESSRGSISINLHISRGVMDSDIQVRVICLMLAYTKSSMHGHERFLRFRVWFWYLLYPLLRFTVQVLVWNFEDIIIRYVFLYIRLEINGGVLYWIIIIHIRMQLTLWTFHSIPMSREFTIQYAQHYRREFAM